MKKIFVSAFLCASLFFSAQSKNTLLDQGFWKSKPNLEAVKAEVTKGNNPTELNLSRMDPIVMAINNDAPLEIIQYLVEQPDNNINKETHEGRTYLHWASMKGNPKLLNYLISKGADVNMLEEHDLTALNIVASSPNSTIETFQVFEKNGVDLKKKFKDGSTVLLLALPTDKDYTLTEYFISKGLSIKDTDNNGNTAVDYAAKGGNIPAMKKLLAQNVKFTDNTLLFAAEGTRRTSNNLETFKYIVEDLKIKPTITNANGDNVLHLIVKKPNQIENVNYFLEKDVDVNKTNNEGNTVFMNAASTQNLDVLQAILPKVKDINATNLKGESALSLAVKNGSSEVVNFLIEKGANTKIEDKAGNNLAYYWVQSYKAPRGGFAGNNNQKDDMSTKLAILQAKGINFAQPQKDGNTLYHTTIAKADINLLKKLEPLKIDINAKNGEGMTVLQKAALISKNDEILRYLISLGAQKDIKTEFGETAYDLARENEYLTKNNINLDFLK